MRAVSLTAYVPGVVYVNDGLRVVESVVPSFWKSHSQAVGEPVETSVKSTRSGAVPVVGVPLKSAVGAVGPGGGGGGGVPPPPITSWGLLAPSRLVAYWLLELVVVIAKLTGPLPVTAEVTSYSTQAFVAVAPALAIDEPPMAGAFPQFRPVSVQPLSTLKTLPPSGLASVT